MAAPMVAALAIEAGIGAMGKLTEALTESVAFYDDVQKASLTLGMNYGTAADRLGNSLDGLGGTIKDKLSGGFEILDAGFQGNIEEMSHVVNQMKLLGMDTKGLHKLNQKLSFSLGLNSEEVGALNHSMLDTSRKYGVSMEKMVDSLDGLSASFPTLLASGAKSNANLAQAVAEMGAGMGEQDKGFLNSFVNKLFQADAETTRQLVGMDMLDEVESMFEDNLSTSQIKSIISELIESGAEKRDAFSMKGLGAYGRELASGIFSKELTQNAKILKIALAKPRQINTEEIDGRNTLSNRISEAFDYTSIGNGIAKSMTGGHAGDPTYVSVINSEGKAGTQTGTLTGTPAGTPAVTQTGTPSETLTGTPAETLTGSQSKAMIASAGTIERELNTQQNPTDPNTSILRDISDGINKTNQLAENGTSNNNFNINKQNIKALTSTKNSVF